MPRVLVVSALTSLALLLGGCTAQPGSSSAGDFEGAEADVAQVVDDIQSAGQEGSGEDICQKYLTKQFADSLAAGGEDCVDQMQEAIQDVNDFSMEVKAVTVSGNTARAQVEQGDEDPTTATFEFAKEGESWRVTSFG